MSKIFLNYRREDSSSDAGRLYDHLVAHFGADSVFIDIDRIDLGVDFVEAINEKIGLCQVLLVLIGKDWLTASDAGGRRLDNPNDFVRLEIVAAAKRNIRIIPVLVEGAAMPRDDQLPDDLKFLARRNAIQLSYVRFQDDVGHLIRGIEQIITPQSLSPSHDARRRHGRRRMIGALAALLIAAALLGAYAIGGLTRFRQGNGVRQDATAASPPSSAATPDAARAVPPPAADASRSSEPARANRPSEATQPTVAYRTVPSVVDLPIADARARLDRQGFQVDVKTARSQREDGTVLEQDPAAGRRVSATVVVRLTVAEQLKVPTITNMPLGTARRALQAAGFSLGTVTPKLVAGFGGPDTVVSQDPAPGTGVADAGPVNVVIERPGIPVPRLQGLSKDQALAQLSKLGLVADVRTFDSSLPTDKVISQNPTSGVLPKGATVVVLISAAAPTTSDRPTPSRVPSAGQIAITSVTCTNVGRGRGPYRLQIAGTVTPARTPAYFLLSLDDDQFKTQAEWAGTYSYLACPGGKLTRTFVTSAEGSNACDIISIRQTTWEFLAFGYPARSPFDVSAVLNLSEGRALRAQSSDRRAIRCSQ